MDLGYNLCALHMASRSGATPIAYEPYGLYEVYEPYAIWEVIIIAFLL